jgi:hypothetical protein
MFPHLCGADLAKAVRNGADATLVVPDAYVIVRGGIKPVPPVGQVFSAVVGPTLEAAGAAVPHNQLRMARVEDIRRKGGTVEWLAEYSNHGTLNEQHVQVVECGSTSFSEPSPNPIPKKLRIDQGR